MAEPACNDFISCIDHWQTLIGSVLGGMFALGVAMLVSYQARRQEEISSAMLLIGNLSAVNGAHATLFELADKEKIDRANLSLWIAEHLVWSRPSLSPLLDASIVRLMPKSAELASHLDMFHTVYLAMEHHPKRLELDFEELRQTGKTSRSKDTLRADANIVMKGFVLAAEHAKCAQQLLT